MNERVAGSDQQGVPGPAPALHLAQLRAALLTKKDWAVRLRCSERMVDGFIADGTIGPGLSLGPRSTRWTERDYEATLARLRRREVGEEPASLAEGRRRRIEAMKAPGAPAPGA